MHPSQTCLPDVVQDVAPMVLDLTGDNLGDEEAELQKALAASLLDMQAGAGAEVAAGGEASQVRRWSVAARCGAGSCTRFGFGQRSSSG